MMILPDKCRVIDVDMASPVKHQLGSGMMLPFAASPTIFVSTEIASLPHEHGDAVSTT